MSVNKENIKIILGLKLKQARKEQKLSLAKLSEKSGLSISYLNEIEKGKKYPKPEKIQALSSALGLNFDELVSLKLEKSLSPLSTLIKSNILNDLPLSFFGIDSKKLVNLLANAPMRVNAFISAILEIARNHQLNQEHFYYSALRAYQELHLNYFEELENSVASCLRTYSLNKKGVKSDLLKKVLQNHFNYEFKEIDLITHSNLKGLRSVLKIGKVNTLYINPILQESQLRFILGREIAFNFLKIDERPYTFSHHKAKNFNEVLNNFKASYFSIALLINEDDLHQDLESFFSKKTFKPKEIEDLIDKYNVSPEMLFQRITNILPKKMGIKNLFFLRFNNKNHSDYYSLNKELHLNKPHNPHGNKIEEHYCRRWITIEVLEKLKSKQIEQQENANIIMAQRSSYIDSKNEYLCLSIARSMYPTPNSNSSVTLGLLVNDKLKNKIAFLNDEKVITKKVNATCERCRLVDCKERATEATVIIRQDLEDNIEKELNQLLN
jgi:transcriptional regulator with XRE-family HTH domain